MLDLLMAGGASETGMFPQQPEQLSTAWDTLPTGDGFLHSLPRPRAQAFMGK